MKAMVLKKICSLRENRKPLELIELPEPLPDDKEILIKVGVGVVGTFGGGVLLLWAINYAIELFSESNVTGCMVRIFVVGLLLGAISVLVLFYIGWVIK